MENQSVENIEFLGINIYVVFFLHEVHWRMSGKDQVSIGFWYTFDILQGKKYYISAISRYTYALHIVSERVAVNSALTACHL